MEDILKHSHSGLRWLALILLIITIVKSFAGWLGSKPFTLGDKKLALFTLISIHLQLVLGLVLYLQLVTNTAFDFAASMKDPLQRFFSVEHIVGMLAAITLVTIGYSTSKRAATDKLKFKKLAIYFTIALLLIVAMIPWPFMQKFAFPISHWY